MLAWLPFCVVGAAITLSIAVGLMVALVGSMFIGVSICNTDISDTRFSSILETSAVCFFIVGFSICYVLCLNYKYTHLESERQATINKTDAAYQTLLNNEEHAEFDEKYKKEIASVKSMQKLFVKLKEEHRRQIFQTWYDTNFNAWRENAKSFAIDTLASDAASMLLRNAKYFSILKITKENDIVTIGLAGQEPQREEPYGSFIRVHPAQHHAFEWVLQRKDTEKHDDCSCLSCLVN